MAANVGPYIANINLEQRRRELKAERFIPLAESFNSLTQSMFALAEYNRQKQEMKANALTNALKMYGADDAPQALINAWGDSIQGATGAPMPRDDRGNVVRPNPDVALSPEERELKKKLTPDQWTQYLLKQAGIGLSDKDKLNIDERARHDKEIEAHYQDQDAARWAAVRAKGQGKDDSSQWTIGPDGHIKVAEPGEQALTHKDINSWVALNRLSLTQDRNDWLKKKDKIALKDRESDLKTMQQLANVAAKIPKGPAKEQAVHDIWENHWRPMMVKQGLPDPGPFKDSKSMLGIIMDKISSFQSTEGPPAAFKSVRPTGNVVQGPTMTPEEEAAGYEGVPK